MARHLDNFDSIHAITFDYGQRNRTEIEAAKRIAHILQVDSHEVINVDNVLHGLSPLLQHELPLEEYKGGVANTFVPMRNQLFLTVAYNRAVVIGCQQIIIGVSQVDYSGYPDCRATFIDSIQAASNWGLFNSGDYARISIVTPLMTWSKKEEAEYAMQNPLLYYALAHSITSYSGEVIGTDAAATLRAKGFADAGIPDPAILWDRAQREINFEGNELRFANILLEQSNLYQERCENELKSTDSLSLT